MVFVLAAVVTPRGVVLEWVTDNSVNPPGVSGDFIIEATVPVPCSDEILFNGSTQQDVRLGLYSASTGEVQVIANSAVRFPGSQQTFDTAWQQSCPGNRVVFIGSDTLSHAVLSWTQGGLQEITRSGDPIADSHFTGFTSLDAGPSAAALDAQLFPPGPSQVLAIKPYDSPPFVVADRTVVLPGQTDPVTIYAPPSFSADDVVFHARTYLDVGFYRWRPGQGIDLLVDNHTPVPLPGTGDFGAFDVIPAVLDEGVVFGAGYPGGFGLFVWRDGEIAPLVVPGTPTADGLTITSAGFPVGRGSLLAFSARTAENPRVAAFVRTGDGRIRRLLGEGDLFDGRIVDRFQLGADERTVAIRTDSFAAPFRQTIYRAVFEPVGSPVEIPALSAAGLALLLAALALAGLWVLRARSAG